MDELGTSQMILEAMSTLLLVGGPPFAALFTVGLGVGAFQAATQINDPALGFIPRLSALVAILTAFGAVIMERLSHFFVQSVSAIGGGA